MKLLFTFLLLSSVCFGQNKKEQIIALNKSIDSLNTVLSTTRDKASKDIGASDSTIDGLNSEIAQLKNDVSSLESSTTKLTSDNEKLKNDLEELSKKNLELEAKLKAIEVKTVKIGNQLWMAENLNLDKFRNGDPIPQAKTIEEWHKAGENGKPAWCYNFYFVGEKKEKLYNWYAVNDQRGLAPQGWRIPSNEDWIVLTDYLGGEDFAGTKMRSSYGWNIPSVDDGDLTGGIFSPGNGTNQSGFSAFPVAAMDMAYVSEKSIGAYWWSSTEHNTTNAYFFYIYSDSFWQVNRGENKGFGFSIRCIIEE